MMKTWEMLKELTENPNKRFRLPSWEDGRYITATNTGLIVNEILELANVSRLKVDWEILPQEVTWQEALEAWAKGREIKCVLEGESIRYSNNQISTSYMGSGQILKGKWYIL